MCFWFVLLWEWGSCFLVYLLVGIGLVLFCILWIVVLVGVVVGLWELV